jgi:Ca2+-binding RTX toxin-like protein
MNLFYKNARKWTGLEKLEDRITPDVTFGFEEIGGALYFQIEGDGGANVVALDTQAGGAVYFSATFDEGGFNVTVDGTITAGDIALAQLITGESFSGFFVDGLGGNDTINGSLLENHKLWAQGGAGKDTITGGLRMDTLEGEAENDVINIGPGAKDALVSGGTGGETSSSGGLGDVLNLTAAQSVINTDFERVNGSAGNDTVDSRDFAGGGAFAGKGTTVLGGDGNDTLVSSAFGDTLDGQGGTGDTISYDGSAAGVIVELLPPGSVSFTDGGDATGDKASNFENITGSDDDDTLIGNNIANVINGQDGNDDMDALGGNDALNGGDGDDSMVGGSGNDTMRGGDGDDGMSGGLGNDNMDGEDGDDDLNAGGGADVVRINWDEEGASNPNEADANMGGSGGDTFVFYNVTFDEGNPLETEVNAILQFLDDQLDDGMMDWDETLDEVDFED